MVALLDLSVDAARKQTCVGASRPSADGLEPTRRPLHSRTARPACAARSARPVTTRLFFLRPPAALLRAPLQPASRQAVTRLALSSRAHAILCARSAQMAARGSRWWRCRPPPSAPRRLVAAFASGKLSSRASCTSPCRLSPLRAAGAQAAAGGRRAGAAGGRVGAAAAAPRAAGVARAAAARAQPTSCGACVYVS